MLNIQFKNKGILIILLVSIMNTVVRVVTPLVLIAGVLFKSMALFKIAACMSVIETGVYFALSYNFGHNEDVETTVDD